MAQLSAQTTRLSDTLTLLTDDILRSGSRLAYEVEVLRGEAVSLSEAMKEGLQDDISNFLVGGLFSSLYLNDHVNGSEQITSGHGEPLASKPENAVVEPAPISHLRTLHLVRSRLQSVISTFDAALSWPLPPSSLSLTSSLISVSGPSASDAAQEEKGLEANKRLRDEVNDLLVMDGEEPIQAAEKRLDEIRNLASVWKGTAEEKARMKFVDGLAKQVQDKRREEAAQRQQFDDQASQPSKGRVDRLSSEIPRTASRAAGENTGAPGFLRNLQRLRDEIYLD